MAQIKRLLFIGCGNMGGAMLAGWLAAGEDPSRFAILDPKLDQAPDGVPLYRDASQVNGHDAVLLGFKPQQLPALAPQLQGLAGAGITLYSLLAGITLDQLSHAFPNCDAHIRIMPNLAARVGKSPIIMAQSGLSKDDRTQTLEFFDQLGSAFWMEDENLFDLATALAGSGPGFLYRFIDALGEAGQQLGLDGAMSNALALQMVEGAAQLAAQSDVSPAQLADRVASPGGMTREGLDVLDEKEALVDLLRKTLRATADKGAELARAASRQG